MVIETVVHLVAGGGERDQRDNILTTTDQETTTTTNQTTLVTAENALPITTVGRDTETEGAERREKCLKTVQVYSNHSNPIITIINEKFSHEKKYTVIFSVCIICVCV